VKGAYIHWSLSAQYGNNLSTQTSVCVCMRGLGCVRMAGQVQPMQNAQNAQPHQLTRPMTLND